MTTCSGHLAISREIETSTRTTLEYRSFSFVFSWIPAVPLLARRNFYRVSRMTIYRMKTSSVRLYFPHKQLLLLLFHYSHALLSSSTPHAPILMAALNVPEVADSSLFFVLEVLIMASTTLHNAAEKFSASSSATRSALAVAQAVLNLRSESSLRIVPTT